jgi:mono/diheme cytochrome c family protein
MTPGYRSSIPERSWFAALSSIGRIVTSGFGLLIAAAMLTACQRPLPEQGSPDQALYARRCGSCHRPYNPRSLTAAMWQVQMQAMEPRIEQAGMPALTAPERHDILSYLSRNAER